MPIRTVHIEQMSVKEFEFRDKKTGNQKKGWNIGLKVDSNWINGAVFNQEDIEYFSEGKNVTIDIFKKVHEGKEFVNFKMPNRLAVLEERIKVLEERMDKASDFIKAKLS
jgi:hypothetical protein